MFKPLARERVRVGDLCDRRGRTFFIEGHVGKADAYRHLDDVPADILELPHEGLIGDVLDERLGGCSLVFDAGAECDRQRRRDALGRVVDSFQTEEGPQGIVDESCLATPVQLFTQVQD